jgi:hypothetical protein
MKIICAHIKITSIIKNIHLVTLSLYLSAETFVCEIQKG